MNYSHKGWEHSPNKQTTLNSIWQLFVTQLLQIHWSNLCSNLHCVLIKLFAWSIMLLIESHKEAHLFHVRCLQWVDNEITTKRKVEKCGGQGWEERLHFSIKHIRMKCFWNCKHYSMDFLNLEFLFNGGNNTEKIPFVLEGVP